MFCFAIGHCHWSSILIRPYNVQILGLNIYSYIEDNDLAFYKTQNLRQGRWMSWIGSSWATKRRSLRGERTHWTWRGTIYLQKPFKGPHHHPSSSHCSASWKSILKGRGGGDEGCEGKQWRGAHEGWRRGGWGDWLHLAIWSTSLEKDNVYLISSEQTGP